MKKCLIVISSFLFLLSSCGISIDMRAPISDDWISYDAYGNETDDPDRAVMWKLKEEGMWVSSSIGMSSFSFLHKRPYSWNEANNYCNNTSQYGFNDWRLPTTRELDLLRQKDVVQFSTKMGFDMFGPYFVWSSSIGDTMSQRVAMGMDVGTFNSKDIDDSFGMFFCVRTEL